MDITKINIEIRPRSAWEAIDLGFALTRKSWKQLYLVMIIYSLPFSLLFSVIFYKEIWVAFIILWALKPFYGKAILHIISRGIFSEKVSYKELLKRMPGFFFKKCIWHYLIFRISSARGFNLPVWELEGLSGKKRMRRSSILKRARLHKSRRLATAFHVLEFVIASTALYLMYKIGGFFLDYSRWYTFKYEYEHLIDMAFFASYYIAVVMIEPFFICATFAAYLNSRTELEGWDIELAFKRMADRIKKHKRGMSEAKIVSSSKGKIKKDKQMELKGKASQIGVVGIVMFFAFTVAALPQYARANESDIDDDYSDPVCSDLKKAYEKKSDNKYEKKLREIMKTDDFKRCKAVTRRELIYSAGSRKLKNENDSKRVIRNETKDATISGKQVSYSKDHQLVPMERDGNREAINKSGRLPDYKKEIETVAFERKVSTAGLIAEIVLWVVGGILLILLLWYFMRFRDQFKFSPKQKKEKFDYREDQQVIDISEADNDIPLSIADKARQLWKNGQKDKAVGLLYSRSLGYLSQRYKLTITKDMTEDGCLNAVGRVAEKGVKDCFKNIVSLWLLVAYAHRSPSEERFEKAVKEWENCFQEGV